MTSAVFTRLLALGLSTAVAATTISGQNPPNKVPAKKAAASRAKTGQNTEKGTAPRMPISITAPNIKFEKYTLPNGLVVILSEDHRLPLVSTNIWYHVGPANELPGRTGFAHLFEHMMFEGSKHVPGNSHFRFL